MGILHPVYHLDIEKKKCSHQDRVLVKKTLILFLSWVISNMAIFSMIENAIPRGVLDFLIFSKGQFSNSLKSPPLECDMMKICTSGRLRILFALKCPHQEEFFERCGGVMA